MDAAPLVRFRDGRIPAGVKLAYTTFLAVLVPCYLVQYGPANFLWFCDVALAFTLLAVWTERPLLASIPAVGIVLPQMLWVADLLVRATTGGHLIDMTEYMFDARIPLFFRGLSLFHGWLPFLLLWLVRRLGYDRRALVGQVLVCAVVLLACFLLLDRIDGPAGNVNKIFGPSDASPQTWMPAAAWAAVLALAYVLLVYVPSHLLFARFAPPADTPTASRTETPVGLEAART
jgi:hypothetical protein